MLRYAATSLACVEIGFLVVGLMLFSSKNVLCLPFHWDINMHISLDINSNYEAQFISILQSLDKRFFNKIEINSGKADFISEDEFWHNLDSKFG